MENVTGITLTIKNLLGLVFFILKLTRGHYQREYLRKQEFPKRSAAAAAERQQAGEDAAVSTLPADIGGAGSFLNIQIKTGATAPV
ncbi:hypothetical protein [Massilia sp. TS11]|uniref:hypothetical protein n=1 Tax=Massilia sp. TS11 TaxID=2908003 RepID=UPI001EDA14B2|nr:hypothetical protein [Massilia sp. TS11]MCG2583627.1 hypothetical protein [Massilia sp. TS11]